MTRLQRRLVISWVGGAAAVVVLLALHGSALFGWALGAALVLVFIESVGQRDIYEIAATPQEYLAQWPHWRALLWVYAAVLVLLALVLLGSDSAARAAGEHLPLVLALLLAPLAIPLAAHQWQVYRTLGDVEGDSD